MVYLLYHGDTKCEFEILFNILTCNHFKMHNFEILELICRIWYQKIGN